MSSWADRGLGPEKFMELREAGKLKRLLMQRARTGMAADIRRWMLIHIAMDTGLRVSEVCGLCVGDLRIDGELPHLFIRKTKGGPYGSGKARTRSVVPTPPLMEHLREYLKWKETKGEPLGANDPLLLSPRGGHLTRQAAHLAFKLAAREAGLPDRYSFHTLRHTYATQLYKSSGHNLRLVQKQLGHAHIQVTTVYADVIPEDTLRAIANLEHAQEVAA